MDLSEDVDGWIGYQPSPGGDPRVPKYISTEIGFVQTRTGDIEPQEFIRSDGEVGAAQIVMQCHTEKLAL